MKLLVHGLWSDESGQDLVEYALLVALIALAVIAVLRLFGATVLSIFFNNIANELETLV